MGEALRASCKTPCNAKDDHAARARAMRRHAFGTEAWRLKPRATHMPPNNFNMRLALIHQEAMCAKDAADDCGTNAHRKPGAPNLPATIVRFGFTKECIANASKIASRSTGIQDKSFVDQVLAGPSRPDGVVPQSS